MNQLKNIGLALLAILAAIAGALWQRERAGHASTKQRHAEAQRDTLARANQAQHQAAERGRQEVIDATDKARRGDFTGMDNHW